MVKHLSQRSVLRKKMKKYKRSLSQRVSEHFKASYIDFLIRIGVAKETSHVEEMVYDKEAYYIRTNSSPFAQVCAYNVCLAINTMPLETPYFKYEPYYTLTGKVQRIVPKIENKLTGKVLKEGKAYFTANLIMEMVFECKSVLFSTAKLGELFDVHFEYGSMEWLDNNYKPVLCGGISDKGTVTFILIPDKASGRCAEKVCGYYLTEEDMYRDFKGRSERLRYKFEVETWNKSDSLLCDCFIRKDRVQKDGE